MFGLPSLTKVQDCLRHVGYGVLAQAGGAARRRHGRGPWTCQSTGRSAAALHTLNFPQNTSYAQRPLAVDGTWQNVPARLPSAAKRAACGAQAWGAAAAVHGDQRRAGGGAAGALRGPAAGFRRGAACQPKQKKISGRVSMSMACLCDVCVAQCRQQVQTPTVHRVSSTESTWHAHCKHGT